MFSAKRLLTASTSESDQFFSSVNLLVHGEGANNSTTFIDSSNFNTTLTARGATSPTDRMIISTVDKKFGSSSVYSKGSVNVFNSAVDRRFTGNFTIEFFSKAIDYGSGYVFYSIGQEGAGRLHFGADELGFIYCDYYGTGPIATLCSPTYYTKNVWHHVAIVRNGSSTNNIKLYLNGIQRGQFTRTGTLGNSQGFYFAGDNYFLAGEYYMDDLRVTDGVARYTANFTPPAKTFPNN